MVRRPGSAPRRSPLCLRATPRTVPARPAPPHATVGHRWAADHVPPCAGSGIDSARRRHGRSARPRGPALRARRPRRVRSLSARSGAQSSSPLLRPRLPPPPVEQALPGLRRFASARECGRGTFGSRPPPRPPSRPATGGCSTASSACSKGARPRPPRRLAVRVARAASGPGRSRTSTCSSSPAATGRTTGCGDRAYLGSRRGRGRPSPRSRRPPLHARADCQAPGDPLLLHPGGRPRHDPALGEGMPPVGGAHGDGTRSPRRGRARLQAGFPAVAVSAVCYAMLHAARAALSAADELSPLRADYAAAGPATGASALVSTSSPLSASTSTVSPSASSRSSSFFASGFSTSRWMARLRGRAP